MKNKNIKVKLCWSLDHLDGPINKSIRNHFDVNYMMPDRVLNKLMWGKNGSMMIWDLYIQINKAYYKAINNE